MKKILASLIVLALVAPVMADVAVTATESSPGVLEITVTPSGDPAPVIRGVALLLGWDDTNTGDGVVTSASVTGLNTNIDYYVTNPIVDADEDNVPDDPGHPAADPAGPGVATLPAADVSLCSGYLDSTGAQGGLTGPAVFTVNYDLTADTLVSIALDTLRGSIVGDDIGSITVQETQLLTAGGDPCRDALSAAEQTDYDAYILNSADPSCWCNEYQCYGDVDNAYETFFQYQIYGNDIAQVVANWKLKIDTADPCADIDHASETFFQYRVYGNDIAILVANWKKKAADLASCPTYVP
jgi:hypothetical protein